MTRKKFSNTFKAKVALEALKGDKATNELASEYEIHVTQLNAWKKALNQGANEIFSNKKERDEKTAEEEKSRLVDQIGRLKIELDWVKKKTGHLG